ncbi:hypothetical protein TNCV_2158661 [Trichonephila clavipes]|nr:hypothetical protein TNCV_2158661 [Trichonephila clavipes]
MPHVVLLAKMHFTWEKEFYRESTLKYLLALRLWQLDISRVNRLARNLREITGIGLSENFREVIEETFELRIVSYAFMSACHPSLQITTLRAMTDLTCIISSIRRVFSVTRARTPDTPATSPGP